MRLIERGAVIGAVLDADADTRLGSCTTTPKGRTDAAHAVDHMDHICQLAGNARHVMIGSDLDGRWHGATPTDLDTIADLAVYRVCSARAATAKTTPDSRAWHVDSFLKAAWTRSFVTRRNSATFGPSLA